MLKLTYNFIFGSVTYGFNNSTHYSVLTVNVVQKVDIIFLTFNYDKIHIKVTILQYTVQ